MTTRLDLDRTLAEWFRADAGEALPDYLDELAERVALERQRPWWSSPERWLPVTTTTLSGRFAAPRPVIYVLLIAALVLGLVGAAIVAGAVWAAWPSTPPLSAPVKPRSIAPVMPTVPAAERAQPTPPSAAPPAAAPPADANLEAKIDACLGAQQKVAAARAQRGGPAPAGQPSDAAIVSRGCAPMYHEAGCRDALMRFDDPPPEKRSATVLTACARAYCGLLAAPKPSVCANPEAVPEDEQQYIAWNDLRTAILTHDIGAAATQRVLSPPRR